MGLGHWVRTSQQGERATSWPVRRLKSRSLPDDAQPCRIRLRPGRGVHPGSAPRPAGRDRARDRRRGRGPRRHDHPKRSTRAAVGGPDLRRRLERRTLRADRADASGQARSRDVLHQRRDREPRSCPLAGAARGLLGRQPHAVPQGLSRTSTPPASARRSRRTNGSSSEPSEDPSCACCDRLTAPTTPRSCASQRHSGITPSCGTPTAGTAAPGPRLAASSGTGVAEVTGPSCCCIADRAPPWPRSVPSSSATGLGVTGSWTSPRCSTSSRRRPPAG